MASDQAIIDTLIAEAVGESDKGLAAVAWTILNRANRQGRTPQQVVNSGAYTGKSSPGSSAKRAQSDPKVRARVERIWNDVSTGKIPDPTGGATHYWAPKGMPGKKDPYWADEEASAAGRLKIGNHVFLPKTTPNSALAAIEQAAPSVPSRRPDTSTLMAFNSTPSAPQGAPRFTLDQLLPYGNAPAAVTAAPMDRMADRDYYGIMDRGAGSLVGLRLPVTGGASSPMAAGKASGAVAYSPIRATGGAQGIAGAVGSGGGSLTYSPPLSSRPVSTQSIAPANTKVPTTFLEQLQLATERAAQNYTFTPDRIASGSASSGTGPVASVSGSFTASPIKATGTASSPSIGGASGSVSFTPSKPPAKLAAPGAGLTAAQRTAMSAVPTFVTPPAQQQTASLSAPTVPAHIKAIMNDVSLVSNNKPGLPAPPVPVNAGNTVLADKGQPRLNSPEYDFAYGATKPPSAAVAAIDAAALPVTGPFLPLPKPQAFAQAPVPQMPAPKKAGPNDGFINLDRDPISDISAQNLANSFGAPIRFKSGRVVYPNDMHTDKIRPMYREAVASAKPAANNGSLRGLLGAIGSGLQSAGLFGGANSGGGLLGGLLAGPGSGAPGWSNPSITYSNYRYSPGEATTLAGNDMAFMPSSVQSSSRWQTGY